MLPQLNTNAAMLWGPGNCSKPNNDTRSADADRFVATYGIVESVEVTNLDDPSQQKVNCASINLALQDAYQLLDAAVLEASWCGGAKIEASFARWQTIIARYYLDTLRRRPEVRQDYEDVVSDLNAAKVSVCLGTRPPGKQSLGMRNFKQTALPRVWDEGYFNDNTWSATSI